MERKKKNRIKKEMEELLKNEIEIAKGNINHKKIIDLDDMGELVEDVENLNIENEGNKKKKKKDLGMDLDEILKKLKEMDIDIRRKVKILSIFK